MALLERVSTLIRANLNDLIDKAEDPEKMIKQVILDMQNQLMQVKTQVAIAIADQHVLEKKQKDNAEKEAEWIRKAELAVDKKQDDLARAANADMVPAAGISYHCTANDAAAAPGVQGAEPQSARGADTRVARRQRWADLHPDVEVPALYRHTHAIRTQFREAHPRGRSPCITFSTAWVTMNCAVGLTTGA